jgi:hypothetical protein
MSLIPPTIDGKIQFFQSKNSPWTTNSAAIGTSAAAVSALNTKVSTAQTKLAAAIAAREAAKTATTDLKLAVRDMQNAGSDIIKQIRAKAATDGDNVYVLAQIPPPALPSPVPPPGTPTDFIVTLNPDGSLKLKWKCANPPASIGTVYQISRRTGAAGGDFVPIGISGSRTFPDATVPAGVSSVTYQIVAVRSTAVGVAAQFTVNFGIAPETGAMTASIVESSPAPKLAA